MPKTLFEIYEKIFIESEEKIKNIFKNYTLENKDKFLIMNKDLELILSELNRRLNQMEFEIKLEKNEGNKKNLENKIKNFQINYDKYKNYINKIKNGEIINFNLEEKKFYNKNNNINNFNQSNDIFNKNINENDEENYNIEECVKKEKEIINSYLKKHKQDENNLNNINDKINNNDNNDNNDIIILNDKNTPKEENNIINNDSKIEKKENIITGYILLGENNNNIKHINQNDNIDEIKNIKLSNIIEKDDENKYNLKKFYCIFSTYNQLFLNQIKKLKICIKNLIEKIKNKLKYNKNLMQKIMIGFFMILILTVYAIVLYKIKKKEFENKKIQNFNNNNN